MSFCHIEKKEPLHPVHTFSYYSCTNAETRVPVAVGGAMGGARSENPCSALVICFQFLTHHLSTLSFTCVFFLINIYIRTLCLASFKKHLTSGEGFYA